MTTSQVCDYFGALGHSQPVTTSGPVSSPNPISVSSALLRCRSEGGTSGSVGGRLDGAQQQKLGSHNPDNGDALVSGEGDTQEDTQGDTEFRLGEPEGWCGCVRWRTTERELIAKSLYFA